jgi:hypothetical protein
MNLTDLKYYDELTPAAQAEARRNIAASVALWRKRDINALRGDYLVNIHRAINDPYHIRRFINGQSAHNKIRDLGDTYLIPYIRANKVIFTECGAYVYYLERFMMVIEGREWLPTDQDQKALRGPYNTVNERGPAFHDWLYGMHHKIKFFMIRG